MPAALQLTADNLMVTLRASAIVQAAVTLASKHTALK